MSQTSHKIADHLGGGERRCHDDKGALEWAAAHLGIKSMLDIGCGQGCVSLSAVNMGMEVLAVDGDPGDLHGEWNFVRDEKIPFLLHDYTEGSVNPDREFDLCWSVEFLEHIEAKYIPNFMNDFQKCKYVFVTAAKPGDGGKHHVNEQLPEYWIDVFLQYGFVYNEQLTSDLKENSSMKKRFFNRNGLVFVKK
jgi:hypothetical protein|tara:strand:- start:2973 stop:3551 length:579 start_codon:yes stop_codon:yes gene_type:complete